MASLAYHWERALLTSNLMSSIEPMGVTYISRIRNVVSANGNGRAVSVVSLLWLDLANNLGVRDFSVAVGWDLVVGNGEEGVGAFDPLAFVGTGANALA